MQVVLDVWCPPLSAKKSEAGWSLPRYIVGTLLLLYKLKLSVKSGD